MLGIFFIRFGFFDGVKPNISAPKRRSILPGVPKSGSANVKLSRCFRLWLNGTACDGKSEVIPDRTKASIFRTFPC